MIVEREREDAQRMVDAKANHPKPRTVINTRAVQNGASGPNALSLAVHLEVDWKPELKGFQIPIMCDALCVLSCFHLLVQKPAFEC